MSQALKYTHSAEGDLVPHFQPIFDLSTGTATRYECFLRKLDIEKQFIAPSINPLRIEDTKLNVELLIFLLKESAKVAKAQQINWNINLAIEEALNPQTLSTLLQISNCKNVHGLGFEIPVEIVKYHLQDLANMRRLFPASLICIKNVIAMNDTLDYCFYAGIDAIKLSVANFEAFDDIAIKDLNQVILASLQRDISVIVEHVDTYRAFEWIKQTDIKLAQGAKLLS